MAPEQDDKPLEPEDESEQVVGTSKPRLMSKLGPGLISGAANDDPTAIATYSQAGAAFGYSLCWLPFLCFPLMVAVQQISGRIGRTTGESLAGNLRQIAPSWLMHLMVMLLLVANVLTLGANLSAMGSVLRGLIGGPQLLYVTLFGAATIAMQVFVHYARYVRVLKWATLSLLGYVVAVLFAGTSWDELAAGLVPDLIWTPGQGRMVVAIFGVAISPYLFFWQSAQEVEDQQVFPTRQPLNLAPHQAEIAHQRIRLDTYAGMAVATFVGFCIMTTAAATLNANGITAISDASEAAAALEPVAGPFAFALFGIGIIGTGILAIPVLAGSAAYAIAEVRRWPAGLSRPVSQARGFYAVIVGAVVVGVGFNFTGISPIEALFLSATINGTLAVPILAMMLVVGSRRRVMGDFTIPRPLLVGGWTAVVLVSICVGAMGVNLIR